MSRRYQEKVVSETTERNVDMETGEVKSETSTKVTRLPSEPPYVKLYLEDLGRLLDLPGGPQDLLFMLIRKIDYEGMITLSAGSRRRIADRLGISDQTFRNRLRALTRSGVLLRREHNEYEANPLYFARGDWRDIYERRKAITMTVTYGPKGREIETTSQAVQEELDLAVNEATG